MDRIAVISDIHGNWPACEAVLEDIASRGISRVFCLGDLIGKGPSPSEVLDAVRQRCEVVVRGIGMSWSVLRMISILAGKPSAWGQNECSIWHSYRFIMISE